MSDSIAELIKQKNALIERAEKAEQERDELKKRMDELQLIDINDRQPEEFEKVLWRCNAVAPYNFQTGVWYGKGFCDSMKGHPMHGIPRAFAGKFGRYAEPAEKGYKATHWVSLNFLNEQES